MMIFSLKPPVAVVVLEMHSALGQRQLRHLARCALRHELTTVATSERVVKRDSHRRHTQRVSAPVRPVFPPRTHSTDSLLDSSTPATHRATCCIYTTWAVALHGQAGRGSHNCQATLTRTCVHPATHSCALSHPHIPSGRVPQATPSLSEKPPTPQAAKPTREHPPGQRPFIHYDPQALRPQA